MERSAMDDLRVLLADDHPVFRDGLRSLLGSVDGVEVVGEAGTGSEAVEQADRLQPDVIVMDLRMPELNGIEATRKIVSQSPHVGIVVLTMNEDDDSVFAAMRAGAKGYLLKGATQSEIIRAVQAVGEGDAIFGPAIAERVVRYFSGLAEPSQVSFPELTAREREILALIAEGRKNHDMARALSLSDKTIRNHVSNIFAKLQVADRSQAIIRAREAGLGGDESR
jgi:DNA-binding NarL/FixJ family response regulator